jgi:hypothetical protein
VLVWLTMLIASCWIVQVQSIDKKEDKSVFISSCVGCPRALSPNSPDAQLAAQVFHFVMCKCEINEPALFDFSMLPRKFQERTNWCRLKSFQPVKAFFQVSFVETRSIVLICVQIILRILSFS